MYTYRRFDADEREIWPQAAQESADRMRRIAHHYSFSGGFVAHLANSWQLKVDAVSSAAESNLNDQTFVDFPAIGVPFDTISIMKDRATESSIVAVADGPVGSIAGIVPRVAVGAEGRYEKLVGSQTVDGRPSSSVDRDRRVGSAFAEVSVPLLENGPLGARRLEVTGAGRYDRYNDFGGSFNPQYSLTWAPLESVTLRSSYAEAFRAPALIELGDRHNAQLRLVEDPGSPSGMTPLLMRRLDNPNLEPESAKTWDVSLQWRPVWLSDASLSITYFHVTYSDRIEVPAPSFTDWLGALVNADRYPQLIDRAPDAAFVRSIIDEARNSLGFNNLTGTPFDPATQNALDVFPTLATFDNRDNNIATDKVSGLDLTFKANVSSSMGEFSFGLNGTYTLDHTRRVTATSAPIQLLNEVGKPVDMRLRANVGWTRRGYGAFVYINYVDSYEDPFSIPNRHMSSWTTADLTLQVDSTQLGSEGWLEGLRITLSADNVFDSAPPVYRSGNAYGLLYDAANASPFGRYLSLRVAKRW